VAPPAIVAIEQTGGSIDLDSIDADSGQANDDGLRFRWSADANQWVYNLGTADLVTGTYRIEIALADGRRFVADLVLK
jgi:hypothetical protein